MRKDFGKKPYFYPLPVLIIGTYDANGTPDAMNAAWGGLYQSDMVELCLSAGHKTCKNILATGAFTVSFADKANVVPADYVGIASGNTVKDKIARAGWTVTKSHKVNAPIINELPMALECTYVRTTEEGNILGRIENISADERILDENGNIDAGKLQPIAYDPADNTYKVLGDTVGRAFADGKAKA